MEKNISFRELRRIAKLFPARKLYFVCTDDEGTYVEKTSRKQEMKRIIRKYGRYPNMTSEELANFADVEEFCIGGNWGIRSLISRSEWKAKLAEKQRRKLEAKASQIARKYKVEIGSIAFIDACYSEIATEANLRSGMAEDGLCIGYGVSYQQWNDDYNYSVSQQFEVRDILDWLESECPLLMAKYRNSQLERINTDE